MYNLARRDRGPYHSNTQWHVEKLWEAGYDIRYDCSNINNLVLRDEEVEEVAHAIPVAALVTPLVAIPTAALVGCPK